MRGRAEAPSMSGGQSRHAVLLIFVVAICQACWGFVAPVTRVSTVTASRAGVVRPGGRVAGPAIRPWVPTKLHMHVEDEAAGAGARRGLEPQRGTQVSWDESTRGASAGAMGGRKRAWLRKLSAALALAVAVRIVGWSRPATAMMATPKTDIVESATGSDREEYRDPRRKKGILERFEVEIDPAAEPDLEGYHDIPKSVEYTLKGFIFAVLIRRGLRAVKIMKQQRRRVIKENDRLKRRQEEFLDVDGNVQVDQELMRSLREQKERTAGPLDDWAKDTRTYGGKAYKEKYKLQDLKDQEDGKDKKPEKPKEKKPIRSVADVKERLKKQFYLDDGEDDDDVSEIEKWLTGQ